MPDPLTWYALGRTVADTETILEAVDTKILTHNLDPSAHGQTGEVMFEHRSATLLDHLFGSVDMKHLVNSKMLVVSAFESTDGWSKSVAVTPRMFQTVLETTAVINNEQYMWIESDGAPLTLDFTKNPFFQTTLRLVWATSQLAYITCGEEIGVGEGDNFGFKVSNGTLYAYTRVSGTAYATEVTGITVTELNVYRAYMDSTESKVFFYVNGVLKHTESTHVPAAGPSYFFTYYIKTTTNNNRQIVLADFLFEQDR